MFRTFVHRAEIDDDRWGLMSVCFRFPISHLPDFYMMGWRTGILWCSIKIIGYENKSSFMGFIVNFNISDYDKITRESPTDSRT